MIGTRSTANARFSARGGPAYQDASDALLREELTDAEEAAAQLLGRSILEAKPYLGWDAALREARKRVQGEAAP